MGPSVCSQSRTQSTHVMLLVAYWLTASQWSLHPVHIWFTPMAHNKQLHLMFISDCSMSQHPHKLHGSQYHLNCIKPAVPIVCILGTWAVENTVMDMVHNCCLGSLWLGLPLSITSLLKEDLQLYNEIAWPQAI